jgi:hypothetical protein
MIVPLPSTAEVSLAVRLAAVPVAISAGELLVRRRALTKGGLLDYEILGLLKGTIASHDTARARMFRSLMDQRFYSFILVVQLLAAGALIVAPTLTALVCVTAVLQLLMMKRNHLANDGSDDMVTVVLVSTAVALVAASNVAIVSWAVFLTGQLLLAYFVSGISKAQSDGWWRGDAVTGVVGTRIFGHPRFAQILARHPTSGSLLTRGTFFFEVLFPAFLFAPKPVFLAALAAMLAFHLGCAVIMGLNTFVWAFAACYPAALWSWSWLAAGTSPLLRLTFVMAWLIFTVTVLTALWGRHRNPQRERSPQPKGVRQIAAVQTLRPGT